MHSREISSTAVEKNINQIIRMVGGAEYAQLNDRRRVQCRNNITRCATVWK